jgi:endonuclease/exonuclease/phosphatase family metal-dependent hydrolase
MNPILSLALDRMTSCLPRSRPGILLLIMATSLLSGCTHSPSSPSASSEVTVKLRVMSWNIHHGEGIDGLLDLERIAQLIRETQPDLVALQEVDRGVARTARRDLPSELAALTGLTPVFSRNLAFQGGDYGNATLSRWPIVGSTNHHYRMLREGEQRGLLQTTLDIRGHHLSFWNTHIDHRPDHSERLSNVEEIRTLLSANTHPVILTGDFNDLPNQPVYTHLSALFRDAWIEGGQGDGATFPGRDNPRRIDYLWLDRRANFSVSHAQVLSSDASDHLPLVVDLIWRP